MSVSADTSISVETSPKALLNEGEESSLFISFSLSISVFLSPAEEKSCPVWKNV